MSYRKITVNQQQHEYVIGKTHTKIKGIGVFQNDLIGERIAIPEYCECCNEPMSQLHSDWEDTDKLAVTPKHISQAIVNHLAAIKNV